MSKISPYSDHGRVQYEISKSWHTYKLQLLAQECDSSASCSKSQEQTHHKNTEEGTKSEGTLHIINSTTIKPVN